MADDERVTEVVKVGAKRGDVVLLVSSSDRPGGRKDADAARGDVRTVEIVVPCRSRTSSNSAFAHGGSLQGATSQCDGPDRAGRKMAIKATDLRRTVPW